MAQIDLTVPGLTLFEERFAGDEGRYVVIGGTARELIYQEYGIWDESATKDLDVVLIAEALDAAFVTKFMGFVAEAGSSHVRRDGGSQMYRFKSPSDPRFPRQIELLCRRPEYLAGVEAAIGKVPVDDSDYSLSAILLEDGYYELLSSGEAVTRKYGLPTLAHEYLPAFKMRAYIDLKARRGRGEDVRSGEVNKHRRDVFRLVSLLPATLSVRLPGIVESDIRAFLTQVECPPSLMKDIGLGALSAEDAKRRIVEIYLGDRREAQ